MTRTAWKKLSIEHTMVHRMHYIQIHHIHRLRPASGGGRSGDEYQRAGGIQRFSGNLGKRRNQGA